MAPLETGGPSSCYNLLMKCISFGCQRKPDRGKECSYHMRIRLYGMCKNECTTPAQGKHGFCSRCRIRKDKSPNSRPIGFWINSEFERYCWSCKEIKKIKLFPISKVAPFGHGGMCKNCLIIRNNNYNPLEIFQYAEKFIEQGVSCVKCRSKEKLEIDHIIPKSIGGKDEMDNFQILCSLCNKRKKNTECIDYRIMIQFPEQ
jgi:5-methylcytosine-specific restriction endonuclease McrA